MSPVRRAPRQLTHTESALRTDYLHQVLGLLWPEPATAVVGGTGTKVPGATSEFVVVPSLARPRLLLPLRARRAAATALRRYSEPRTRRARLRLELLALAMASGLGPAIMRDRVRITAGATPDTIESYLADALGGRVQVSLHIGPARANRKPVLQLLSDDGDVVGFAKVGINDLTRRLVAEEAQAIGRLADARLPHTSVPRLLHHGTWKGLEVLVQSPLPIWEKRVPFSTDRLVRSMLEVAAIGGVHRQHLVSSPYWARLGAAVENLADDETGAQVRAAFRALTQRAVSAEVPLGAWHGDWTPWNMASVRGRLLVWDWERLELGVPLGFDALHFELQSSVVGTLADPRLAVGRCVSRAEALLEPFGIRGEDAEVVALTYLVALAVRYLQDGQAEAGARLGVLGQWLLPELVERVTAL